MTPRQGAEYQKEFKALAGMIAAGEDVAFLERLSQLRQRGNGVLNAVLRQQDDQADTLLHRAVQSGHAPLVSAVLDLNPPQDIANRKGETPLSLLMLLGGPEEAANRMIELGAPLNSRVGLKHSTLVHEAVLHHMNSTLALLLRYYDSSLAPQDPRHVPLNDFDDNQKTPLMTAIETGNATAALMLAKHEGVDLSLKDKGGERAIDRAGMGGNAMVDTVLAMMDRGQRADEIPTGKAHSPFGAVVSMCTPESVRRMIHHAQKPRLDIDCTASGRPLETAIELQREDNALMLLEEGAPDRLPDEEGYLPLHSAAKNNMVKLAKALVARGVPQDQRDRRHNLPLHYAFYNGSKEMMAALDQSPALMDTINHRFATPFEETVFAPRIRDMVNQFIERVVLPAFLIEAAPRPELLQDKAWMDQQQLVWSASVETIKPAVFRALFGAPDPAQGSAGVKEALTRVHQLSDTWHHDHIHFPTDKLPLKKDRVWHPLFTGHYAMQGKQCVAMTPASAAPAAYDNQFVSSKGYILTPLTKTGELVTESAVLNHCVGKSNYAEKCCAHESHIIGIRKLVQGDDGPVAAPIATSEIEVKGKQLKRGQTKTQGDRNASREIREAVDELLLVLHQGQVPRNPLQGETDPSKATFDGVSEVAIRIGFHPDTDWRMVNDCFQEYKRNLRRASQGSYTQDGEDRLLYIDQKLEKGRAVADRTFDHYTHPVHFIDGTRRTADSVMAHRDMDVQSWLRATGVMDVMRSQIELRNPRYGLDATQLSHLKARWAAEDAAHPIAANTPPPKTDREREADAASWDASSRVGTTHHYGFVDARTAGMGKGGGG